MIVGGALLVVQVQKTTCTGLVHVVSKRYGWVFHSDILVENGQTLCSSHCCAAVFLGQTTSTTHSFGAMNVIAMTHVSCILYGSPSMLWTCGAEWAATRVADRRRL